MFSAIKRFFASSPPPSGPPLTHQLGIGVVFSAEGKPRLEKEFVENLSPVMRVHVNNLLMARGFRLSDQEPYYTEGV